MLLRNLKELPSPCHVIDIDRIKSNLDILEYLRKKTNLTLLFAIKGFSNPEILKYFISHFNGICASSLWEARLSKELTALPVHTFSPAYQEKNFPLICHYSNYIIFNSINQLERFGLMALSQNISCGIRINPEYSEVEKEAINPCHYASRFGIHTHELSKIDFSKVNGIHFHTMCEQYFTTFINTLNIVEKDFGKYLQQIKWLNIGGGQFFCDKDYPIQKAIDLINRIQSQYDLTIIAEPCETIMSDTGYFVATVTDIVFNEIYTAILDASAICHLPDIVYSPYRCDILNSAAANVKAYTYRIAGSTCYAGDIFGDYSFDTPLDIGSKIIFYDTAPYSMVKSNVFNGIQLPAYVSIKNGDILTLEKSYSYETFLSII